VAAAVSPEELPLDLPLTAPRIVVDGHIDTPQRMLDAGDDISRRLGDGHVDIPRMRDGGIGAAFFSIWVDDTYAPGAAYNRAQALIDAVRSFAERAPDAELATSAAEVRAAVARGRVAALMGLEGGHAIENSLEKLDALYARGVRYMTLTWNNGNDWAGSSLDPVRQGGLSPFGRTVIRRMNELGMLVDVSHVSDATFWDVMATTKCPVIASHSGCRALAAHPRNLTDAQLRAVAANDGLVGIIFFPVFLDEHFAGQYAELNSRLQPQFDAIRARYPGKPGIADLEIDQLRATQLEESDIPELGRLVDHIDHAVQVMGIDHVGLGSDFDGIGVLPRPMKDATSLPLLAQALEARGYGDSDVRKILGENFLRVLSAAP
jgi:membrane dipeptidase